MPIAGKGMLVTSMNVPPSHEAEFNLWYDREHLAERVAIDGFMEARRYVAVDGFPKFFCLYSTETFEVLSSPAYKTALANQTDWSKTNMSRFADMGRALVRITASRGQGRGGALAVLRLRPRAGAESALRARIEEAMAPGDRVGLIAMHLLESDPALSKSLTEPDAPNPGAADWYVLIDGWDLGVLTALAKTHFTAAIGQDAEVISTGSFTLMWDLAKADL